MLDPVSEIKSRIPIEELVASYVQLKKVGRQFKALCPFHNERTPSFYISTEKQMAFCFGCRKGGDHFAFIQEIEGMTFPEALEFLAARAGIDLPRSSATFQAIPKSEKDVLYEIHRQATEFYEQQLWETPEGEKVKDYFLGRGLTLDTLKSWHLGFASDGPAALYTHLLQRGHKKEDIIRSGLVLSRDSTGSDCVDRFRMRAMFPIRSFQGTICGFGGRVLRAGDEPKYLNSPETPIYHKSNVLYGYFEAKNSIRNEKSAIVVEGYMDVIGLHQAGVTNVVASSGTALTREQLRVLKRISPLVYFAFDQDNAGQNATERGLHEARAEEVTVKVISWPDAKDPDELVREHPEAFRTAITSANTAQEFLLNFAMKKNGSANPLEKKNALESIILALHETQNALERDEWIKQIALSLAIAPATIYDELKRFSGKQRRPLAEKSSSVAAVEEKMMTKDEFLIMLLLTKEFQCSDVLSTVTPNFFQNESVKAIYTYLLSKYNQAPRPVDDLSEEQMALLQVLELYAEKARDDLTPNELDAQLYEVVSYLLRELHERSKREFLSRIQRASRDEQPQLLAEYEQLLAASQSQTQQHLWQKS